MNISDRMLLTAASPGSCFAEDKMQGHSCVCMNMREHIVNQSHKTQLGRWASFTTQDSHALKLFMVKKDSSEGFPSKLQTLGNAPILSGLLYAHITDILTNYFCELGILVKGIRVFEKGSQDSAIDNYRIQVVKRDISEK